MAEPSPLTVAFNFRDPGGLRPNHGRELRPGLPFRNDTRQALTDADERYLVEELRLELIVDLRPAVQTLRFHLDHVGSPRSPSGTSSGCCARRPGTRYRCTARPGRIAPTW